MRMNINIAGILLLLFVACDYNAEAQGKEKIWKKQVYRVFDLDPEDTMKHHLRDMRNDRSLYEILDNAVFYEKLNAYDSTDKKLTVEAIYYKSPDTSKVIDPITMQEKTVVSMYKTDHYDHPLYKIIEEWSFDIVTGNTTVGIRYLAPAIAVYDSAGKFTGYEEKYRLKFEDVSPILAKFEEEHPNKTLALLLWNEHFLRK